MPNYADGHVVSSSEFNSLIPVGCIVDFGGTAAPSGWLICDGSAVSRTTYADLFAAIGTTHGAGDGSTTFNLPDLRGRVRVGTNAGTFTPVGAKGGEETHSLSISELASHSHSVSGETSQENAAHSHSGTTDSGGAHNHTVLGHSGSGENTLLGTAGAGTTADSNTSTGGAHTHAFTTSTESANHEHTFSVTSGSAGGGTGHNNLQPYMALISIIRY